MAKEKKKQEAISSPDKIRINSYLNEDDIYKIRYDNDDRSSVASYDSDKEEVKVVGLSESDAENMREYCMKKGKVKSSYIMKKEGSLNNTLNTELNADLETICTLNSSANIIYRIIRHQLNNQSHPIRMIIDQFSEIFVTSYKGFINKSTTDVSVLKSQLESMNTRIFSEHKQGEKLKKLHLEKRKSEKKGKIQEADKMDLPNYFISKQVIDDCQVFINQIVKAVINFYSVVAKRDDLNDINEELVECMTDYVLTGKLQTVVFTFFKLEAENKKKLLIQKYKDYLDIRPEHVGIDEKFALNNSSPIIQIYEYMTHRRDRINHSVYEGQSMNTKGIAELPESQESDSSILQYSHDPDYQNKVQQDSDSEDERDKKRGSFTYINDVGSLEKRKLKHVRNIILI